MTGSGDELGILFVVDWDDESLAGHVDKMLGGVTESCGRGWKWTFPCPTGLVLVSFPGDLPHPLVVGIVVEVTSG